MIDEYQENDNVGWLNPEDAEIPADLPQPRMWRVLVLPVQPKRVSRGGILLPTEAQDNEAHLQVIGKVAAMGPLAFRSFKHCADVWDCLRVVVGLRVRNAPKVGDWVGYSRYAGDRMEYKSVRLVVMNDDTLLLDLTGPEGFRIYI